MTAGSTRYRAFFGGQPCPLRPLPIPVSRSTLSCRSDGVSSTARLAEAMAGLDLGLSAEDVPGLEAAVPASAVAGTRDDPHQMRTLDSER